DFVRGGSYVYQQGMKRMVGVWSGGGYGAANGFAALAVFTLPLTVYYFYQSSTKIAKCLGALGIALHYLCIMFSATRGALVVAIGYALIYLRSRIFTPKVAALLVITVGLTIPLLPENLRHRFWDLTIGSSDEHADDDKNKIARESAESRWQGFM